MTDNFAVFTQVVPLGTSKRPRVKKIPVIRVKGKSGRLSVKFWALLCGRKLEVFFCMSTIHMSHLVPGYATGDNNSYPKLFV